MNMGVKMNRAADERALIGSVEQWVSIGSICVCTCIREYGSRFCILCVCVCVCACKKNYQRENLLVMSLLGLKNQFMVLGWIERYVYHIMTTVW